MVYRTISSQMKQRALELLDQGWEVGYESLNGNLRLVLLNRGSKQLSDA
jgi:hypothetical protein